MKGDDTKATEMTNGSIRDLRRQLRDQITKSTDGIALESEQSKEDAHALAVSTKWWLIGSATAGLTLAIGLICTITIFGVVRPLSATTGAMNGLANGNLNEDVSGAERKDEVGLLSAFRCSRTTP